MKRLSVCLVLVVTTVLVGAESADVEYLAIFLQGKKVGHAIQTRVVGGDTVTTTEQAAITISRAGVPVTVDTTEVCIETTDGKPISFSSVQDLGMMQMRIRGELTPQHKLRVTVSSAGTQQVQTIDWPEGAVMAEGLRLLALKKGLKQGTRYSARIFSPSMAQAMDANIVVGPRENVDLLGRVVPLTRVTTNLVVPGAGKIVTTSYVDDELRALKVITPIAGMDVEMVACTKDFALSDNDVIDVIEKMFVASPSPLGDAGSARSITYYLRAVKRGQSFEIPSTDNQSVKRLAPEQVVVTVRPVPAPAEATLPYKGDDPQILEALKPTRYLQCDDEKVVELAKKAVGSTNNAATAAKRIEAFVARYVKNQSLSVGYGSAAEVAESRTGDCTEFAVLTAAMCRAAGIPARVVAGLAYIDQFAGLKNQFGGHAWVEAYIADRWVGLDAAFKSAGLGGYDAGHIALAVGNGNPEDFFSLVASLGLFRIEKVVVEPAM